MATGAEAATEAAAGWAAMGEAAGWEEAEAAVKAAGLVL